jgi:hypothetical protein
MIEVALVGAIYYGDAIMRMAQEVLHQEKCHRTNNDLTTAYLRR